MSEAAAQRLAESERERMRYVQAEGRWYLCSRTARPGYWSPEDRHGAQAAAREAVRSVGEAVSASRVDATLKLARDRLAARTHEFDADPWLLGLRNGVLDLRTGDLLGVRPEMLLTVQAPVDFDPGAAAPSWGRHVARVAGGDPGTAQWLQMACGVSLVGADSRKPHFFPFLLGEGGNGKGTFIRAFAGMLGELTFSLPAKELTGRGDPHPTTLAELRGRRFVYAEELSRGSLNTSVLKALTGGDWITARRMRQDNFTFPPSHVLWLVSNHAARFGADVSEGVRRRYMPVETGPPLTEAERNDEWEETLASERSGILNWALEGLRLWTAAGHKLPAPPRMRETADEHLDEQDLLAQWWDECVAPDPDAWASSASLLGSINTWRMIQRGLHELKEHEHPDVWDFLKRHGLKPKRRGKGSPRGWLGVRVVGVTVPAGPREREEF